MKSRKTNAEYCRDWYQRNRARKYEMQIRRKQEIAEYLDALKQEAGCRNCSERDPACLVFHHRNPATKFFHVSEAAEGKYSLETIRAEVGKCDVLCANCHLKLHWVERQERRARAGRAKT